MNRDIRGAATPRWCSLRIPVALGRFLLGHPLPPGLDLGLLLRRLPVALGDQLGDGSGRRGVVVRGRVRVS